MWSIKIYHLAQASSKIILLILFLFCPPPKLLDSGKIYLKRQFINQALR